MKQSIIAVSAILTASLAFAGEVAVQSKTTAKDSPLVQAAKSTNRAKKRIVITEESLKGATGHITTTKSQPPVYLPPLSEQAFQAQNPPKPAPNDARSAEVKKAQEQKAARLERLATEDDEGPYSEMDPAKLEHQLETAAQAPKQEVKKP